MIYTELSKIVGLSSSFFISLYNDDWFIRVRAASILNFCSALYHNNKERNIIKRLIKDPLIDGNTILLLKGGVPDLNNSKLNKLQKVFQFLTELPKIKNNEVFLNETDFLFFDFFCLTNFNNWIIPKIESRPVVKTLGKEFNLQLWGWCPHNAKKKNILVFKYPEFYDFLTLL